MHSLVFIGLKVARKIYVSQGSVATQLRCGGMLSNHFNTNFPQNMLVKKMKIGQYLATIWTKSQRLHASNAINSIIPRVAQAPKSKPQYGQKVWGFTFWAWATRGMIELIALEACNRWLRPLNTVLATSFPQLPTLCQHLWSDLTAL